MTRAEALTLARQTVDGMTVAPLNSRGYPVDGWRAPTLSERTEAILAFANFLMAGGELGLNTVTVVPNDPYGFAAMGK